MHLLSHWITNHGLTGENPERMGTSNTILCPLRVFPTKTQPVFVAGTNDAFWRLLCTALGKQGAKERHVGAEPQDRGPAEGAGELAQGERP